MSTTHLKTNSHKAFYWQLSSKDFGMAQSRSRVYIVMVQDHLASKEKLVRVFDSILKGRVLPAFQRDGRGTVSQAREFVENFLTTMEWVPTMPTESKD